MEQFYELHIFYFKNDIAFKMFDFRGNVEKKKVKNNITSTQYWCI